MDLCDAGYVGYTRGHLHTGYVSYTRGHKQQPSAIAKHYKNVHGTIPQDLLKRFEVLKKCRPNLTVYEMLFYKSDKAKSQRAIGFYSFESIFIISA